MNFNLFNIMRGVGVSAPVSGGGGGSSSDLLTLNAANDGTAGYKYLDWSASYLGAFRLNAGDFTGELNNLSYAPHPTIGIRSTTAGAADRILISGHSTGDANRRVAEYAIPALSTSTSLASLNIGANQQNFINAVTSAPSESGNWASGARVSGIYADNGKWIINVYAYYDDLAVADQTTTVLNDVTALSTTNQRGFFAATDIAHCAGWVSPIPAAYQSTLGGNVIFGMSSGNLRSRNFRFSVGPSLYVYDTTAANSITGASPPANGSAITAVKKLDYPLANAMTPEANLSDAGYNWTQLSEAYYGFIVPGTRTYAVFGYSGGHDNGLGYGVPPYNPTGSSGFYPTTRTDFYNYYWLFDLDDITGATNSYDPQPYEHGVLTVEFEGTKDFLLLKNIGGGAFDPENGRLYLSLVTADNSQVAESAIPLIVVYDFSGVAA